MKSTILSGPDMYVYCIRILHIIKTIFKKKKPSQIAQQWEAVTTVFLPPPSTHTHTVHTHTHTTAYTATPRSFKSFSKSNLKRVESWTLKRKLWSSESMIS